MDYPHRWKQFLSQNSDIQGGAFLSADGTVISSAIFGSPEHSNTYAAHCAAFVAIAKQLSQDAKCGECETCILEGEQGYVGLIPMLDKTILAVLARKQANVGLLILDMLRVIDDGTFGPGLSAEPIFPPRPPKRGTAHAKPELDW